jgi:hypothetical protein
MDRFNSGSHEAGPWSTALECWPTRTQFEFNSEIPVMPGSPTEVSREAGVRTAG